MALLDGEPAVQSPRVGQEHRPARTGDVDDRSVAVHLAHLGVGEPSVVTERRWQVAVAPSHELVRPAALVHVGQVDEQLQEAKPIEVEVEELRRVRGRVDTEGRAPPHRDEVLDRRRSQVALRQIEQRSVGEQPLHDRSVEQRGFADVVPDRFRALGVEAGAQRRAGPALDQRADLLPATASELVAGGRVEPAATPP